jgi:urease accessory protein
MKSIDRNAMTGTAALAAFMTLAAGPALAHTGVGTVSGLAAGFAHPVGGLDHVLAMVAVGILAAQQGGRALWLVPAAFLAMMVAGGALGAAGFALPYVELGIVGSVIVLGAVVAAGRRMPVVLAMALAGIFAVFHGHAHGTEMPLNASGLEYGAGFVLATALLHGAGVGLGLGAATAARPLALRFGGGAIALAGLALAAG